MGKNASENAMPAESPTPAMPVLYSNIEPLSLTKHGHLSLRPHASFAFAAKAPGIPVMVSEFMTAARSYPIVFVGRGSTAAIVVTGVGNERNLFVDENGGWDKGAPIPVYVRRHPFIFMKTPDGDQLIYSLDSESDRLRTDGNGEPLFMDDQPAAALREVMTGMNKVQEQFNATSDFIAALETENLLVPIRVDIKTADGTAVPVEGFRIVDEARFNAVPDETFLEWRRKGWIAPILAHLLSQGNWQDLADRLAEAP